MHWIWVRVPMCTADAQACAPAGVHGSCIYRPEELLTSPTACRKATVCVSAGALNLTVEGEGWLDWSWGFKQTSLMDNKDKGVGGWVLAWVGLGWEGMHKGWNSRGKVPRVHMCLCLVRSYVVYLVLAICSFTQSAILWLFKISASIRLNKLKLHVSLFSLIFLQALPLF